MRVACASLCLVSTFLVTMPFGTRAAEEEPKTKTASSGLLDNGRPAQVDTRSTATSSTFDDHLIDGLPIIGHNYQDVLILAPGVTDVDGDGDQRNEGSWRIDGRIEKGFKVGRVDMAGFLIVENILDSDDLTIFEKRIDLATEGIAFNRDFGRRFEIGAIMSF